MGEAPARVVACSRPTCRAAPAGDVPPRQRRFDSCPREDRHASGRTYAATLSCATAIVPPLATVCSSPPKRLDLARSSHILNAGHTAASRRALRRRWRARNLSARAGTMRGMEHTREQMDPAKLRLSNNLGDYAPYEVFAAMLYLHDAPDSVVAAVSDSREEGGRTTWRALWLTDSRLVYCEASANVPDWELASRRPHGSYEAEVDAWTVPISAVTSVGVDAARMFQEHGTWSSDVHAIVRMTDRPAITLPLFGDWPSARQQDACDALARELLARLR
jgi:hypothetical protein